MFSHARQPFSHTTLFRQTAKVGTECNFPGLLKGKCAQQEEGHSRLQRLPVRVAAPGIEHHPLAAMLRKLHQHVLELERVQCGVMASGAAGHAQFSQTGMGGRLHQLPCRKLIEIKRVHRCRK